MLATCRKLFEIIFHGSYMRIIPQHMSGHVKDTCMKILGINKCMFYMLVTCRKCFRINTIAAKIITKKNSLQRNCFGTINFVKFTKESLYKANSLACFLAKRDTPVAATLQRKSSGGINFVITTKIITKENVPRNYFVIISAGMVMYLFRPQW